MSNLITKPLGPETWTDFASLVERNGGIWGGCWCMGFHPEGVGKGRTVAQNRASKQWRVMNGNAHAALVYDGSECVGWCQFGSPEELPRIKNLREYLKSGPELPDWRITCFFSGKGHRGHGVAGVGLRGAISEIARLGGGRVEGYPEDADNRSVSASFLFNGTLSTFEREGFTRARLIGKHKWVVTRVVQASQH